MLIQRIRRARTLEHPTGCDLVLVDGLVASVEPKSGGDGPGVLDVAGRVVLPAFVDAHVHLDKAFANPGGVPPELPAVLAAMASLRRTTPAEVTRQRMSRAVDALVHNGTTAARVQVEIERGTDLLPAHQALAADATARIAFQLVAFPQNGLVDDAMPALMDNAMARGAHVVGGCPYVDPDPRTHLDLVFSLADRWSAPVDLHLDFSDGAAASLIPLVAKRTLALGMAGRVTIGHVTTLAAMDEREQLTALETLANAGISLVVLPATDLYLMGHGSQGRSLAPYEKAQAAGVRTAIGNNNMGNAFAPFGNASQLQAAWLAGLMRRSTDATGLLSAVTSEPADILGLEPHGTAPGQRADLVVLDHDDVATAMLQAPPVREVLRGGRLLPPWVPAVIMAE